jgi:hypothetical protein
MLRFNINFSLDEDLYNKLLDLKNELSKQAAKTKATLSRDARDTSKRKRGRQYSWESFFKDFLTFEGMVGVNFVSVDGGPAKDHIIVFQLGKYGYVYENGHSREWTPTHGDTVRVPARLLLETQTKQ